MHQSSTASPGKYERVLQYGLLAALLTVSFSTWLTNVFAILTLFGSMAGLLASPAARRTLRSPPALMALALLAALAIGSAWSIAPRADVLVALKKYLKLSMLPVAIGLCWRDPGLPRRALIAYAGGSAVLALSCYLTYFEAMPQSSLGWWRVGDTSDAFAFKNHITIGILLSFSAAACFLFASYPGRVPARLAWLATGVWVTIPVVILSQGRTGYLALLVALVVLFLLRVRVTVVNVLIALAAAALLFTALYCTSDNLKLRMDAMVNEAVSNQEQSPTGLRISFMRIGTTLVADSPVFGQGTGAFAEGYENEARRIWGADTPLGETRHQPHSEFMGIAVQLGATGLLLYFTLLGTLLRPALRARARETDLLVLLWTVYVFCSAFNSLLWDPTEAYWFLMLAGCLYVAAARTKATRLAVPAGDHAAQPA